MFPLINYHLAKARGRPSLRSSQISKPKPNSDDDENNDGNNNSNSPRAVSFAPTSASTVESAATQAGWTIMACVRSNLPMLLFPIWILVGIIFYTFHPGEEQINGMSRTENAVDGFYQAVTIGFSVGLAPRDPNYVANPWFSSAYILVGASLIAAILTSLGRKVEENSSQNWFEDMKRREQYEQRYSDGGFVERIRAFCVYNMGYLISILLWVFWLVFIIVWSIIATSSNSPGNNFSFSDAQYFAISMCSSAGSFPLPSESPLWAYGLAGIGMACGVPLMALAISSVVIMLMQNHKFTQAQRAAYFPVTKEELATLTMIGLGHSEEVISKSDFVLLGILRMGEEAGLIQYLCDAYDQTVEERGCVTVRSADGEQQDHSHRYYSEQARAYVGEGSHAENGSPSNDLPRVKRLSQQELRAAMASLIAKGNNHTRKQRRSNWSIYASKGSEVTDDSKKPKMDRRSVSNKVDLEDIHDGNSSDESLTAAVNAELGGKCIGIPK